MNHSAGNALPKVVVTRDLGPDIMPLLLNRAKQDIEVCKVFLYISMCKFYGIAFSSSFGGKIQLVIVNGSSKARQALLRLSFLSQTRYYPFLY